MLYELRTSLKEVQEEGVFKAKAVNEVAHARSKCHVGDEGTRMRSLVVDFYCRMSSGVSNTTALFSTLSIYITIHRVLCTVRRRHSIHASSSYKEGTCPHQTTKGTTNIHS